MAALVSRIMPYVTVAKVGKEVTGKNGPSCVFLIREESLSQNPFSRIPLKFHWPELGPMLTTS